MIEVVNVHKSYRSGSRWVEALRGVSLPDRARPVRVHRGPERVGQEHAALPDGGDRPPELGRDRRRRPGPGDDVRGGSERLSPRPGRFHLSVVQPDQQPDGPRERAGSVLARGVTPELRQRAVDLLTRGRPGGPARPPPVPAFRRRTAASGDRPRPGEAADPGPRRRADRRARLEDRRRDLHDPPPRFRNRSGRRWSS